MSRNRNKAHSENDSGVMFKGLARGLTCVIVHSHISIISDADRAVKAADIVSSIFIDIAN